MTTPVPDTFNFPSSCLAVGRQAARLGNLAAEVSQHALSVKLGDVDELKSRHLPRSQHVTRQIRQRFLAPASPPARCFDHSKDAGSREAAAHVSEPVTVWESTAPYRRQRSLGIRSSGFQGIGWAHGNFHGRWCQGPDVPASTFLS